MFSSEDQVRVLLLGPAGKKAPGEGPKYTARILTVSVQPAPPAGGVAGRPSDSSINAALFTHVLAGGPSEGVG